MSGINYLQKSEFDVDHQFILKKLNQLNTMVVGTILFISESTATVNIYNTFPKIDSLGNETYTDYPNITTNFITLSLFQYVPSIGDKVILFVSQSDISGFLNDSSTQQFQSKFNLYDSVMLPISLGYNNPSVITAGKSELGFDVNCSSFNVSAGIGDIDFTTTAGGVNINTLGFKVTNTTGSLITMLTTMLTAVGGVSVPGGTINSESGGAVTACVAQLETFNV